MHQLLSKNHDRIIMDNNSEYGKNLEESYPCTPRTFMTEQEEMKDPNRAGWSPRVVLLKGMKRRDM